MLRNVGQIARNSFRYVTKPHQSEFIQDFGLIIGGVGFGSMGFLAACGIDHELSKNKPIVPREEKFHKRLQHNLYVSSRALGLYGGMTLASGFIGAGLGQRPFIGVPLALVVGSALIAAMD